MFVFPKYRTLCRSVVRSGTLHVSVTRSPLREARKSDGGFGNSSDGGLGGPIDAHPQRQKQPATISNIFPVRTLMRRTTDYITRRSLRRNDRQPTKKAGQASDPP
jgi:hypothetical protein